MRYPNINPAKHFPQINGPFRGIRITFNESTDYKKFQETYHKITLAHPNFLFSTFDRRKSVIYYKSPYDIAILLKQYHGNTTFQIDINIDDITKNLEHNVLFINKRMPGREDSFLNNKISELNGHIIINKRFAILVKFNTFFDAAIAHFELRKMYKMKFAYKDSLPHNPCTQNTCRQSEKINRNTKPSKPRTYGELADLLKKKPDDNIFVRRSIPTRVVRLRTDGRQPNITHKETSFETEDDFNSLCNVSGYTN